MLLVQILCLPSGYDCNWRMQKYISCCLVELLVFGDIQASRALQANIPDPEGKVCCCPDCDHEDQLII